jgi:hypothetical protein
MYGSVLPSKNCGTIKETHFTYTSPTCNCTIHKAMLADYDRFGGNSGGAVSSESGFTAVGLHSGANGAYARFSHIVEALDRTGTNLMTAP